MITLFGSHTSPFVRRVRIVCIEKDLDYRLVNSLEEPGKTELQKLSPIAKVPVAIIDDDTEEASIVFDSHVIIDTLCEESHVPLRPLFLDRASRVAESNAITLIDEAVLAFVRRMYLERDGSPVDAPYLQKDHARAQNILMHLDRTVAGVYATSAGEQVDGLGLAEVALATGLDWIAFRERFDLTRTPRLAALLEHWNQRPSFAQTRPGTC